MKNKKIEMKKLKTKIKVRRTIPIFNNNEPYSLGEIGGNKVYTSSHHISLPSAIKMRATAFVC